MPSAKQKLSAKQREELSRDLTQEMQDCARRLDFERAAYLRDRIRQLEEEKK